MTAWKKYHTTQKIFARIIRYFASLERGIPQQGVYLF